MSAQTNVSKSLVLTGFILEMVYWLIGRVKQVCISVHFRLSEYVNKNDRIVDLFDTDGTVELVMKDLPDEKLPIFSLLLWQHLHYFTLWTPDICFITMVILKKGLHYKFIILALLILVCKGANHSWMAILFPAKFIQAIFLWISISNLSWWIWTWWLEILYLISHV